MAVYLAVRTMVADKRTSLLLIASVFLSVTIFLVFSSLMFGFQHDFIAKTVGVSPHVRITSEVAEKMTQPAEKTTPILNQLNSVIHVKPPNTPDKIRGDKEIVNQLKSNPEVAAVASSLSTNVIIRSGSVSYPASMYGIIPMDENAITGLNNKVTEGRLDELMTRDKALAMGQGIARKLGTQVGDTLQLTARDGSTYLFRVVAIINTGVTSQDNSRLWARLKDVQTVALQSNEVTAISIKLKDYERAEIDAAEFAKLYGYRSESWQQANSNMLDLFKIIFANIYFVLGGILLAAGFGIYNIFSMAVIDRRREIAIMQAMGFDRQTLSGSFFCQGLIVGLIGGVAGLILGQILIGWMETIEFATQNQYRAVDTKGFVMLKVWWIYAGSCGIGVLLSVVSSFLPAWRAGALNPVDVIREG